ncbi:MAG: hypothetical protein ACFCUQ_01705 [Kiloniellales bacterium]
MRREDALVDYEIRVATDFSALETDALAAMAEAGQELVEIHRVLAKTSDNVVGELLRGQGTFYEWDHYPPGDVYDAETHGQYYYHAHPPDQRFPGEHGHFHTFLRPKGMPPGIKPAPLPGVEPQGVEPGGVEPRGANDALSHLVAVAMDAKGVPTRLFTVNRWVTGETWYRASDVARMIDHFKIDHARPSWPVNRWITALVRLFKPQVLELLTARDQAVAAWARHHPGVDVYEDRNLEVTSFVDISIEQQVRAVGQALVARQ